MQAMLRQLVGGARLSGVRGAAMFRGPHAVARRAFNTNLQCSGCLATVDGQALQFRCPNQP